MRKKNYKGRCEKRILSKCKGVCRTYDEIQFAYAEILQNSEKVKEFQCNTELTGEDYTTDFICIKTDGDIMVRECVLRKHLSKPITVKMLDLSREYWLKHGVTDWGLVVNEE